jgi:hypothetical protein
VRSHPGALDRNISLSLLSLNLSKFQRYLIWMAEEQETQVNVMIAAGAAPHLIRPKSAMNPACGFIGSGPSQFNHYPTIII